MQRYLSKTIFCIEDLLLPEWTFYSFFYLIRADGKHLTASRATWPVFSKSISVSQLGAVPLKSSGSRTFLHTRLPAVSRWKMELSGLEGYMSRDSLTQPFVWLRWTQPDSSGVPALQHSLHYGQILQGTHSSKPIQRHCYCIIAPFEGSFHAEENVQLAFLIFSVWKVKC